VPREFAHANSLESKELSGSLEAVLMRDDVLKGKNALVTGASGGLGPEIALQLSRRGVNVHITGRRAERLEALCEAMAVNGAKTGWTSADLRNDGDIDTVVSDAEKTVGEVDILVNCAGVFPVESLAESTADTFDECFGLNIRAPFLLCRAVAPRMVERQWGRMVNIGSSSAYAGFKETSVYCASKHALLGLSRALHDELKVHNVRTYCISPGSIKTPMGERVRNQKYETFLEPREVAEYVCFVISFDGGLVSEEIRLNRTIIQ
jgi:NAD(P)-dependent dehydrogenase (short-subunit alcohol dehydrogenase family)